MTITNNPKASGSSFNLDMGQDSSTSNQVQKTTLCEPVGGTFITPAQDGTDATGITQLAGGVGLRGWLSGIFNKLSGAITVTQSSPWLVQPATTPDKWNVRAADGDIVNIGSGADAAWSGSGPATLMSVMKAVYNSSVGPIPTGTNPLGSVTGPAAAPLALDSSVLTLNSSVTGNRPIANFFAPSVSEGTTNPFSTDLQRNLRVTRQIFSGTATPTVTSNGAYSAGDAIGGKMSFAINLAARIITLRVTSKSVLTTNLNAYIFNSDPSVTTWPDKAAPNINTADISKLASPAIVLSNPDSKLGTMTVWGANNINLQFPYNSGSIWLILVGVSAFTLTSASTSDFTVRIGAEQ